MGGRHLLNKLAVTIEANEFPVLRLQMTDFRCGTGPDARMKDHFVIFSKLLKNVTHEGDKYLL